MRRAAIWGCAAAALSLAFGLAVVRVGAHKRQAAPPAPQQTVVAERVAGSGEGEAPAHPDPVVEAPSPTSPSPPTAVRTVAEVPEGSPAEGRPPPAEQHTVEVAPLAEAAPPPAAPAPRSGKPPPQNPAARAALSLVGRDPQAKEVWLQAINNPGLPAEERKDLIEDLNEDGFADPSVLTADDLPLINSRLRLIEELAPEAIDDVNVAAFQEAYKDLVNMRRHLTGE